MTKQRPGVNSMVLTLSCVMAVSAARCSPTALPGASPRGVGSGAAGEPDASRQGSLVSTLSEFDAAVAAAQPGDVIVLASRDWRDAELRFFARGTEGSPITLRAQEKGQVRLTGLSNLQISGEHLVVEGLVFTEGHSPTGEVISFTNGQGQHARHTRLTECVIDGFNGSSRMETEIWVNLWGQHNRIDHCSFTDKRNLGVTMAVRMADEASRHNHHRIDHNYFGPRQNLGSNGGETLRVGTSHYSLETSATLVEENYFDRVDGEHEIISSKSGANQFVGNTFFESRGTLTFRHGNDSIARDNFFFGNGKDHTGGIRIINERNQATNNYFYGLTGYRFRGALVVMNGVPNSPPNRYYQVVGGVFTNNTFVNSDHVQLGAGADEERTLPPKDSTIANNVFFHATKQKIFTVYDDMSGITFSNNYMGAQNEPLQPQGFSQLELGLKKNEHGVFVSDRPELKGVGCSLQEPRATRANTGVSWYQPKDQTLAFDVGRTTSVEAGTNTLHDAIENSQSGDTLVLGPGEYRERKIISIRHPVSIVAGAWPLLRPGRAALFVIENGGALRLQGLKFTGKDAPDMAGNAIIRTSDAPMNRNYQLIVENCDAADMVVNHSFDFFRAGEHTFADVVRIQNSRFKNISGHVVALDKDREDLGSYNAEYVTLVGSTFRDVKHTALTLRRGGTDESTFGPILRMKNNEFVHTGYGKRNETDAAVYLHGVQVSEIDGCRFTEGHGLRLHLTNGDPVTTVKNCTFKKSKGLRSNSSQFAKSNVQHL